MNMKKSQNRTKKSLHKIKKLSLKENQNIKKIRQSTRIFFLNMVVAKIQIRQSFIEIN
jgi:hypothetical protein